MKKIIPLLMLPAISGCWPQYSVRPTSLLISKDLQYSYVDYNTDSNNDGKKIYFRFAYNKALENDEVQASGRSACAVVRDRITFEILTVLDENFGIESADLRKDRAFKDTFVGLASIGLTGAASLVGGGSASVLAAIDTGFKGANSKIDDEYFQQKAFEAIINEIRRSLAAQKLVIFKKTKSGDSCSKYTLEEVLLDLTEYRRINSVTAALISLAERAGMEANMAVKNANEERGVK